jgi:glycerol kinase
MRHRKEAINRIANREFDVCVIGGGATGAGCALDAQLRSLRTVIVEAGDFASGSSTASTKMVHGGVRYLQEAVKGLDINQYQLVKHALRERLIMLRNAPHLTRTVEFLLPCFSKFEKIYYGLGMKMYDWIAGKSRLLPSRLLTREEALYRMPAMQAEQLVGAVAYADGQFDDARYALALITTFSGAGGEALNYARVTALTKNASGKILSATVVDERSSETFEIRADAFVNATGPFCDAVRQLASSGVAPRMRLSKGVHIMFPLDGFPGSDALLGPKTEDDRVIFAIPWNGRLLVGTTDTGYTPGEEMAVTREEIAYLLRQINPYLSSPLAAEQVVSGFAGVRPLVAAQGVTDTKKLIRDDEVEFDAATGLISILGGKWTTHRMMAEETIDKVQEYLGGAPSPSRTSEHLLAGGRGYKWDYWQTLANDFSIPTGTAQHLAQKYGTLAPEVLELASSDQSLALPLIEGAAPIRAQVVYAVRKEMALTIEDVLARRIGLQLFSWRLGIRAAPTVAALLRKELGWSSGEEQRALEQYAARVNHMIESAGQTSEPMPSTINEVVSDTEIRWRAIMPDYVAAIDQGTTSTRFMVFDRGGRVVASAQSEHEQIYPRPGWVEHDPNEIWRRTQDVAAEAMEQRALRPGDLAAIGITNQRETTVLWNRRTGEPASNALVWQDTRVGDYLSELARDGGSDRFRAQTGLPLSTYFSSLKIRWLLENVRGAREQAEAGELLFGTIDTFLLWQLTGGPDGGLHVTDCTNASRTQLMNLRTLDWDAELLSAFGIPRQMLPEIRSSSECYGAATLDAVRDVPIAGILGDQQAALVGQTCFRPGEAKNTYGTGCFLLMNTGEKPVTSKHGLLTTVAYRIGSQPPAYALEGSIAITGALVQWIRDNFGLIGKSSEIETLARTVKDNGGIYFVPAFSGLYAPYWKADARGVIAGLTSYTNKGHLARAVLEATAFQTREVVEAMEKDSGIALDVLRTDGGMVEDELLMQFQADILNRPVVRPLIKETTALGAAYAAGLAVGFYKDLEDLRSQWAVDQTWHSHMAAQQREALYSFWKKAVSRSFDWLDSAAVQETDAHANC